MAPETQFGFTQYTDRERLVDRAVHVLGVVSSIVAIAVLVSLSVMEKDAITTLSVVIYGVSVIAVFVTSAIYHTVQTPDLKMLLRRFDHAAIFAKIAGTYTPFAMVSIGGQRGAWLLAIVWGIAVAGISLKLGGWRAGRRLSAGLYLAQGWLILFALGPFREALEPVEFALCAAGGWLYTAGVGFYLASRLPHHNAIWHLFVWLASCCFYFAILKAVVLR